MSRVLVPFLVIASLLALSACGQEGSDSEPLVAAANQAANEKSARCEFDMRMNMKREEVHATGTADAAADGSRTRGELRVSVEGQQAIAMDTINIRDHFWYRSPAFELPHGKRWVHSVDRSTAPQTMTLRELLDVIRESGDVEELGGERIRGRATTHYKATLPIDELFERSPQETRDRLRERFEQFKAAGLDAPIEVWIDGEGLLRRIEMSVVASAVSFEFSADILDYGVNVPAAPPAAETVIEEGELSG